MQAPAKRSQASGEFRLLPGIAILENYTLEISTMQCLVISKDAPMVEFLFNYNLKDNVNALKGNFIACMKKQHGRCIRKEELVVTFAGRQLYVKENIAKLRVPYTVADRTMSYNASNEPFFVSKRSASHAL